MPGRFSKVPLESAMRDPLPTPLPTNTSSLVHPQSLMTEPILEEQPNHLPERTWQPLIQIRPEPNMPLPTVCNPDEVAPPSAQRWYRWLTRYIPFLLVVLVLLYVVSEILLKHLAFRSLQQDMIELPEMPPPLSSRSPAPSMNELNHVPSLKSHTEPKTTTTNNVFLVPTLIPTE